MRRASAASPRSPRSSSSPSPRRPPPSCSRSSRRCSTRRCWWPRARRPTSTRSAGLDWARGVLAQDARTSAPSTRLDEGWAQPIAGLPVERALVAGAIADEQGKFNLNNLVDGNAKSDADIADLQAPARVPRALDPQLADAVVDWIDRRRRPRERARAPKTPTTSSLRTALPRGQRAAWCRSRSSTACAASTRRAVAKLRPYVTALPERTTVNVNTAPRSVLAALLPEVPPRQGRRARGRAAREALPRPRPRSSAGRRRRRASAVRRPRREERLLLGARPGRAGRRAARHRRAGAARAERRARRRLAPPALLMKLRIFLPAAERLDADDALRVDALRRARQLLREGTSPLAEIPRADDVEAVLPAARVLFARLKLPKRERRHDPRAAALRRRGPPARRSRAHPRRGRRHATRRARPSSRSSIATGCRRCSTRSRARACARARAWLRKRAARRRPRRLARRPGGPRAACSSTTTAWAPRSTATPRRPPARAAPRARRGRGARRPPARRFACTREGGEPLPDLARWSAETGVAFAPGTQWEVLARGQPAARLRSTCCRASSPPRSARSRCALPRAAAGARRVDRRAAARLHRLRRVAPRSASAPRSRRGARRSSAPPSPRRRWSSIPSCRWRATWPSSSARAASRPSDDFLAQPDARRARVAGAGEVDRVRQRQARGARDERARRPR